MTLPMSRETFLLNYNMAIPINCFVSHRPTDPLFFLSVQIKKFSILKELYYFEIIF